MTYQEVKDGFGKAREWVGANRGTTVWIILGLGALVVLRSCG